MLATAEFWVAVAFAIFVGVLIYLGAHKLIIDALDERAAKIKAELDEARRLREEAQSLLAEYERKKDDAGATRAYERACDAKLPAACKRIEQRPARR